MTAETTITCTHFGAAGKCNAEAVAVLHAKGGSLPRCQEHVANAMRCRRWVQVTWLRKLVDLPAVVAAKVQETLGV